MAPRPAAAALLLVCVLPLGAATPQTPAPATVTTERSYTDARLGMTAIDTEIQLPVGFWEVAAVAPAAAVSQVYLMPMRHPDEVPTGRTLAAETRKIAASIQWRLQYMFEPIAMYAASHKGLGPKSLTELDPQQTPFLEDAMYSPWPEDMDRIPRVPYTFLIPGARIQPKSTFSTGRTPVLLELRPFADDGQHWVLFSNGEVARVPIDRTLVEKYKLTITPVQLPSSAARPAEPRLAHRLMALRLDRAATSVTVTLRDRTSSATRDVRWTLNGGTSDPAVLGEWAAARALDWYPLALQTHSPILQAWIDRTSTLYGEAAAGLSSELPQMMRFGAAMDRSVSAFDVLGGRAAVRETLQMELMRSRGNAPPRSAAGSVPISTLKGVEVAGLPFDQLLAGKPGGRLALADFVPEDRLFLYFAKPSAVFPFLSQGGDMLGRSGSAMTATAFDDDLKRRYLRRLGLPEESSRKLLESGAITELAITAPDLFFIDGTDLTVLMRLRAPDAAVALGALAGVNLTGAAITARPTTGGRSAYWARQGDILALSTNRREIEEALRLGQAGRSLGRSAELRYMLTQLPVQKDTRALLYLSDPFIRRMVGPAIKIGQLRRVRAAAEMSLITAGALLYRLDGRTDSPDLATLTRLGYVPEEVARPDYRVQPDLSVVSTKWGTLAELTTIETAAIATVTREEADAYQTYVEEYRRYWRQFFDPIAMRLDDAPDGALELTTFILPLIDSEMYSAVAGLLGAMNKPLRVPHTKPEPVFQLSLNLSDDAWASLSSGFRETVSQFTGINADLFDLLGPGLHIAIQDADPIISFGTSDLLGAFGASTFGPRMDMAIPFALSLLTRPCKIFMELQDAPRALALMRRAASAGGPGRDLDVTFRQIGNRDAWTYTFGVPGIAQFRLGLEIQNGYLVISNIPWSNTMTIDRVDTRTLNGAAIQVRPDAVKLGLASLFATQAEQDQAAALTSMAALYPLLKTTAATPAEAATQHAALFGTTPLHPGPAGEWSWTNGQLESSEYGTARRWKAPAFDPARASFGLFNGATLLDLTMQFEQGGLRAIARWQWQQPAPAR